MTHRRIQPSKNELILVKLFCNSLCLCHENGLKRDLVVNILLILSLMLLIPLMDEIMKFDDI